jgi:hypothetical protein
MKVCPTKAIRVRERKARINYERCIDCGECLRICSCNAVLSLTTTPSDLQKFKFKVAIPSPVLYAQFGQHVMPGEILGILKEIGFDSVYDEALMCEMTTIAIDEYLSGDSVPRPVISSTCPVVVRLIKSMFPDLCNLIIPIEPPREIAAKNLRKEISQQYKIPPHDIGIIHITPCAAKMVSINRPETMEKSHLDGALSVREVYGMIITKLRTGHRPFMIQQQNHVSGIGLEWALDGGESRNLKSSNSVAVSGVVDTIKILEDVEAERLKGIEYLECLICPEGCIGGPLNVENRFIAKSNINRMLKVVGRKHLVDTAFVKKLYKEKFFSFEKEIRPGPFAPLDADRVKAINKLQLKTETMAKLPGINCGVCGAPDCETLAEDIARGDARIEDCKLLNEDTESS